MDRQRWTLASSGRRSCFCWGCPPGGPRHRLPSFRRFSLLWSGNDEGACKSTRDAGSVLCCLPPPPLSTHQSHHHTTRTLTHHDLNTGPRSRLRCHSGIAEPTSNPAVLLTGRAAHSPPTTHPPPPFLVERTPTHPPTQHIVPFSALCSCRQARVMWRRPSRHPSLRCGSPGGCWCVLACGSGAQPGWDLASTSAPGLFRIDGRSSKLVRCAVAASLAARIARGK